MNEAGLIQTKEIEVGGKRFLLSKINPVDSRDCMMEYMASITDGADMSLGSSEKTLLKILPFVCVKTGEIWTRLETKELVNSHVTDVFDLISLEMQMVEYNWSFFGQGKTSAFSEMLKKNAPNGSAM